MSIDRAINFLYGVVLGLLLGAFVSEHMPNPNPDLDAAKDRMKLWNTVTSLQWNNQVLDSRLMQVERACKLTK